MDIGGLAAPTGKVRVAAATVADVWETVRHSFLLFGRGQPDPVLGRWLDAARWELAVVPRAHLRQAQVALDVYCMTRRVGLFEDAWTLRPGCVPRGENRALLPADWCLQGPFGDCGRYAALLGELHG